MRKYLTIEQLDQYANGNWLDILSRYTDCFDDAIKKVGKHVDCPFHKGKSDFRIDKSKGPELGLSFCTCGHRNGWKLLCEANNWSIIQAKDAVAEYFGLTQQTEEERKSSLAAAQKAAEKRVKEKAIRDKKEAEEIALKRNGVWFNSIPISHPKAKVARQYFLNRRLDSSLLTNHVRYHSGISLRDDNGDIVDFYPGIISRVSDNGAKPITLHRTYLDRATCNKLDTESPKKLMPVPALWSDRQGRIIPVTDMGDNSILGIAEGIETALAASMASGISVWATVSAGPMTKFVPPEEVKMLVIFADLDRSKTGELAAEELIANLKSSGWQGTVVVQIPDDSYLKDGMKGVDWADVWYEHGAISFATNRKIYKLAA